jgi:hypothetical protein
MPLEPRHPQEPALHHELRDALNRELRNTRFFVWIDVRPTGDRSTFEDLPRVVAHTELWLDSLDPDAVDPGELPERWERDPAAEVHLRAIPKKQEAWGSRSTEIVGNPEPILVGWTE